MYELINNYKYYYKNNDKERIINKKNILSSEIKLENNVIWKIKN